MSSVSSVGSTPVAPQPKSAPPRKAPPPKAAPPAPPPQARAADGDTQAQEALESNTTKRAEKQGGGFAATANSPGAVNKIA
jgi:hypothetical protein